MNVKLITKTISNTLIVSILTLVLMPASFAKRGGGGKPPPPEPEPVETSCKGYGSDFPAFAVKQLKYGRKGSVSGYDILLSNQGGDCTVKLVSVSDNSDQIDLKLKVASSSGMVIWRQTNDEKASRKSGGERFDVIRSINFQVSNKEVSSISSVNTLANSRSNDIEYNAIDLSADSNTLLVQSAQPGASSYYMSLHEIDIYGCSSNCSLNPIYTEVPDLVVLDAKYNDSGNRIYLVGYYRNISSNGSLAGMGYISFIENQNGIWSSQRHVALENNGLFGSDYSYPYPFKHLDVASTDLGSGVTESVAYTFYNPATGTGQFEVQVIDAGNCTVSGSGDCLSMYEASIKAFIPDATEASLTSNSVRFSSASDSDIFEYNFSNQNISPIGSGHETDDAN